MRLRHLEGEIIIQVDDIEKFERDLGMIVEREPDVEQVRSLDEYAKQMQIANQQILKDQGVDIELDDWISVSETKRKVFRSYARAVLDLAGVKYREG
jgi:uncharacterized membrane protein YcgQ (UPF0703/DUF1980 family)